MKEPIWRGRIEVLGEFRRTAAMRFVAEQFGAVRSVHFYRARPDHFWFDDGMWVYRIAEELGVWAVYSTDEKTKRGRDYGKARRLARSVPKTDAGCSDVAT